jgi:hypothetical protein
MSDDIRIPRELAGDLVSLVDNLLDHEAEFQGGTIRRIADHIRPQLHSPREDRVGDVKQASGNWWIYVGPPGPCWWDVTNRRWRTSGELDNYPTAFNLDDELKARAAGPVVVHLMEDEAQCILNCPDTSDHTVGKKTYAALAEYRQRKEAER